MEININEYIRTEEGLIGKVKRIELDEIDKSLKWYVFDKKRYDMNIIDEIYINKPYIKKHSFNIIDLIEEGDVIVLKDNKKYEVLKISWSKVKGKHIHIIYPLRMKGGIDIFENDIKSIVTKEQFKSVEYEV